MVLGVETLAMMAVAGLWGMWLRPLLMRFAAEMLTLFGRSMRQIFRGTTTTTITSTTTSSMPMPVPSLLHSTPYSNSFLHWR